MEVPLIARYSTTENCGQCWKKELWAFRHHLLFHMLTERHSVLSDWWWCLFTQTIDEERRHLDHDEHILNYRVQSLSRTESSRDCFQHSCLEIPDFAWNYTTSSRNSRFHCLGLYYLSQLTKLLNYASLCPGQWGWGTQLADGEAGNQRNVGNATSIAQPGLGFCHGKKYF